jgi:hypothetical protein
MRPPAAWRSQVSFALDGEEVHTVSATEMVSWRDLRSSPTSLAIARRAGGRKLEFGSVSCGAAIFNCASIVDSELREGVQGRIDSFQICGGRQYLVYVSSKQMPRISMHMFVIISICSLFLIISSVRSEPAQFGLFFTSLFRDRNVTILSENLGPRSRIRQIGS